MHRPPSPEHEALRALRNWRDELMQMQRMELNRLEHADNNRKIKASLTRNCKLLKAEADALQAEIAALIQATPEFRHKADLMRSLKGVGPLTVAACLAYLPELGTLSRAEVAAVAGLAPHANDSGQHRGARHIGGGRKTVRTSLYMAALVARSCNPTQGLRQHPQTRGKPNKVVLTAIMRKLIVILKAVLKSGLPAKA